MSDKKDSEGLVVRFGLAVVIVVIVVSFVELAVAWMAAHIGWILLALVLVGGVMAWVRYRSYH